MNAMVVLFDHGSDLQNCRLRETPHSTASYRLSDRTIVLDERYEGLTGGVIRSID